MTLTRAFLVEWGMGENDGKAWELGKNNCGEGDKVFFCVSAFAVKGRGKMWWNLEGEGRWRQVWLAFFFFFWGVQSISMFLCLWETCNRREYTCDAGKMQESFWCISLSRWIGMGPAERGRFGWHHQQLIHSNRKETQVQGSKYRKFKRCVGRNRWKFSLIAFFF